jgi:hypothetical protein
MGCLAFPDLRFHRAAPPITTFHCALAAPFGCIRTRGYTEQLLMAAPLIIRDQRDRPDQQEIVLMLTDFSFTPSDQIFAPEEEW